MRILALLMFLAPLGCQRSTPDAATPEAPTGPPVFVRKDGAQIHAQLGQPLPPDPVAREAACLAGLAQAKLMADEPDARVQQRAKARRLDCRTFLAELWTKRAETYEGGPKADACLNARAQVQHLRRDDPKAANGLEAGVDRVCSAATPGR
ncbi:MAG: hypothetical protein H6702_21045 [Myxococcales bacterium]|nr:hypothetical protein [Myxococcales bacterium]